MREADCADEEGAGKDVPEIPAGNTSPNAPRAVWYRRDPAHIPARYIPVECTHLTLFVAASPHAAALEDVSLTLKDFNLSKLAASQRAELTTLLSVGVSLQHLPNELRAAALPTVNPMPWGHKHSSTSNTATVTSATPAATNPVAHPFFSAKRARPNGQSTAGLRMKTPKVSKQAQRLLPASHRRVKLNKGTVVATPEPVNQMPKQKTVPCKYCNQMFATPANTQGWSQCSSCLTSAGRVEIIY